MQFGIPLSGVIVSSTPNVWSARKCSPKDPGNSYCPFWKSIFIIWRLKLKVNSEILVVKVWLVFKYDSTRGI
jgi:hypothetical protein